MRFKLSLVLVALLLVPSGVAVAARNVPPAVQKQNYVAPNGVRTVHWDDQMEQLPQTPMTFQPRPGDGSVTFNVADAYGRNVLVHVVQLDKRTGKEMKSEFCATRATIPVHGEEPLEVYVYAGICVNHNAGFATTGSITAKFSRAQVSSGGHKEHY